MKTSIANIRYWMVALCLIGLLAGCGGGGGGGGGSEGSGDGSADGSDSGDGSGGSTTTISNAQELSEALEFDGATKRVGEIGSPDDENFASTMTGTEEFVVTQNSDSEIVLNAELAQTGTRIGAVFLKLDGADHHYVIPIGTDGQPVSSGTGDTVAGTHVTCAMAPCGHEATLTGQPLQDASFSEPFEAQGEAQSYIIADGGDCCAQLFEDSWDGQDEPSNWTQPVDITFSARNVGSGNIQITLTWGNSADLDLHVTEPSGFEIYYAQKTSSISGGELDVDDIDGFGPENIFYDTAPPAGDYDIEVKHFSGPLPASYNVSVSVEGNTQSYSGTLTESNETDAITTISSSGSGSSTDDGTGTDDGSGSGGDSGSDSDGDSDTGGDSGSGDGSGGDGDTEGSIGLQIASAGFTSTLEPREECVGIAAVSDGSITSSSAEWIAGGSTVFLDALPSSGSSCDANFRDDQGDFVPPDDCYETCLLESTAGGNTATVTVTVEDSLGNTESETYGPFFD